MKQWVGPKAGPQLPLILIDAINSNDLGMLPIGSVGIIIGSGKDVGAPAYGIKRCPRQNRRPLATWSHRLSILAFKKITRAYSARCETIIGKALHWFRQNGIGSRKGRNNGGLAPFCEEKEL
jgi:hypothetical protein